MLFTLFFTLEVVVFFIVNLTKKYDNNSNTFLLVYLFTYNLGDFVGKGIPPRFNLKNIHLVHLLTLSRAFFQIYFVVITLEESSRFLIHPALRIFVYLILGISNGYSTNNYFCIASNRFQNIKNKDYAGFLMLFGLILGVTLGSFSGVLWVS